MQTILVLLLLCVAPVVGGHLGKWIWRKGWLSNRWRVFLASLPVLAGCAWLALSYPWVAVALALFGYITLREGRSYPVETRLDYHGSFGGSLADPFGPHRPRVSDGATWGDVHRRDRNLTRWSQKSDLREMQEGALGSIGSASGRRFESHPPVIRRTRPSYVRLVVDNDKDGRFPPKGSSAKRGNLRSVK
ncbi:MAG: hypothetical protein IT343_22350 [Candidatus Melainabacteria bacterium]|jgi:hypothetical protein|nr:hypothetical protein [Candidatus Melainabacteria bacterium]